MTKNIILVAEDDEDDYLLLRDAFKEVCNDRAELIWTKDGEETLKFLKENQAEETRPRIVFLDLNMPKIDGRHVLREIRTSEVLNHLPIVVLTNSSSKDDIIKTYKMGVNSFVRKPAGYDELIEFVSTFCKYWFDFSKLA